MNRFRTRIAIVAGLAFSTLASGLFAVTATQSFTLTVPSVLTITAPSAATATHDATDANQAFASQAWTIAQNQINGSTCTFSVAAPFTHASATTNNKRNAKLTLSLGTVESLATWSVTTANDQTDYANVVPDNSASVVATSVSAGNATLNLVTTFLDTDYSTLPQGAWAVTVTGTLLAD